MNFKELIDSVKTFFEKINLKTTQKILILNTLVLIQLT